MFKPGDILKHKTDERYSVYSKTGPSHPNHMVVHVLLDESEAQFPEGYEYLAHTNFWELAYREEESYLIPKDILTNYSGRLTPDALHVPEHELEYKPHACVCGIVALMQTGCKCGGK